MEKIFVEGARVPQAQYSPAVKTNGMIYVSGQVASDLFTGERFFGDMKSQTLKALENIKIILESAGSSIDKIVNMTIYISDIDRWQEMDDACGEFFKDHKPSRIACPVKKFRFGFDVEIVAIAEA